MSVNGTDLYGFERCRRCRRAADDQSRAVGDVVLVQTVFDVCNKNAEKTTDEAVKMVINALPDTDVKKPGEIK